MAWRATADPVRFDEAIAWFARRMPMTEELLEQLGEYAGPRAWKVSGVEQLDVVLDVFEELERAIADGTPLGEFKKSVREKLTEAWGGDDPRRIEMIYRTNVQSAYSAGRHKQLTESIVAETRPYWMFDALIDSRTSDTCTERNGTVLHHDDPWWNTNHPPLHPNCRSAVRALRPAQAERRGINTQPPSTEDEPSKGFGKSPAIDAEWEPDPSKYPPDLWAIYEQKQAAR